MLYAKLPDGCCVPEDSIPAVAEGHFTSARAANVGINPHGAWKRKDFLPKEWWNLDRDDLDEKLLNRVWAQKTRYFENHTDRYFTMVKPILNACGVTYGDKYGTNQPDLACSLDLVKWTIDPVWSKLPRECSAEAQSKLLSDGAPFFKKILQENENIKLLLGTGKTHVALGLCLAACQRGLSVGFTTASTLVHELIEANDDRRLLNLQKKLSRLKLLIIDELGSASYLSPRPALNSSWRSSANATREDPSSSPPTSPSTSGRRSSAQRGSRAPCWTDSPATFTSYRLNLSRQASL